MEGAAAACMECSWEEADVCGLCVSNVSEALVPQDWGGHRAPSKSRIGDNRGENCSVCPAWRCSETREPALQAEPCALVCLVCLPSVRGQSRCQVLAVPVLALCSRCARAPSTGSCCCWPGSPPQTSSPGA